MFQTLIESGPPDATVIIEILGEDTFLDNNVRSNIIDKLCKGKPVQSRYDNFLQILVCFSCSNSILCKHVMLNCMNIFVDKYIKMYTLTLKYSDSIHKNINHIVCLLLFHFL